MGRYDEAGASAQSACANTRRAQLCWLGWLWHLARGLLRKALLVQQQVQRRHRLDESIVLWTHSCLTFTGSVDRRLIQFRILLVTQTDPGCEPPASAVCFIIHTSSAA